MSKMLTGRVLPPILHTPPSPSSVPPIATFFNVPRRYVKSKMQVGDNSFPSPTADEKSSSPLRKSHRIYQLRSASTTSPIQRTKEQQLPSAGSSSSRASKRRVAPTHDDTNGTESPDSDSPADLRAPQSASSTASGEFSGHVCLCQPEPKIPRPRNGKPDSYHFFMLVGRIQRVPNMT